MQLFSRYYDDEAVKLRSLRPGRKRKRTPSARTRGFSALGSTFILFMAYSATLARGKSYFCGQKRVINHAFDRPGICATASDLGQLHQQQDLGPVGPDCRLPVI